MKHIKLLSLLLIIITFFSLTIICVNAADTASNDTAVISAQDDKYTPLYTKSPDSTLKDTTSPDFSAKDYQLFYTQTTLLALIAGYLIVFKIRCLNHDEKMHRRNKTKE